MNHITAIGLDVHARSIYACAFNIETGETTQKRFGYDPDALLVWARSFEDPWCVYESGCTGFHLARYLNDNGLSCVVAATARLQKPAMDKRKKNDRRDAAFLALSSCYP